MRGGLKIAPLLAAPILEWLFWSILVIALWAQTDKFDQRIIEFRFGADGWPKAVLLCLWIGATLQAMLECWRVQKNAKKSNTSAIAINSASLKCIVSHMWQWLRKNWRNNILGIFIVPLLYVWLMRYMGYFIVTPLFLMLYLLVLGVRRWKHILAVSFSIYALLLLVFVRLFYIALPVGSWLWCYEVSNFIITLVRSGL